MFFYPTKSMMTQDMSKIMQIKLDKIVYFITLKFLNKFISIEKFESLINKKKCQVMIAFIRFFDAFHLQFK